MKNFFLQVSNFRPTVRDLPILVQGAGIAVLFGRLFYDSWIAVTLLLPLVIPWFIFQKKMEKRRRIRVLGIQFRDAIASVLTSLKAGYSIENAFRESGRDMELLYGKKSPICKELKRIYKGLNNNIPLEKLMGRLGKESGNADIEEFAEVFAVAKRSGGNMTDIIGRTISVISRKIDVEKEIDVLISSKRLEAGIMNFVPFFIIFYISITSNGFFAPLYHNVMGVVLMTICMLVYFAAYLLSQKIVNITV
ncbi:MAG: type II secretion system F family protein [Butyrivibrio sp.]|nr:type II secretion system F family protein [Butyrivibrio sp.]